jgi:hypothetical protein
MFEFDIAYNQYEGLENIPDNIVTHMINNNENLFKMLKYDDLSPLSHSNLTSTEKRTLIYKGETDSTPFRIFLQPSTDDAVSTQNSQLRVYIDNVYPEDRIKGLVTVTFEVLTHNKLNTIEKGHKSRSLSMANEVLKTFNGCIVESVGELFFNAQASRRMNYMKQNLYNGKNYFGYSICMSTWVGNVKG